MVGQSGCGVRVGNLPLIELRAPGVRSEWMVGQSGCGVRVGNLPLIELRAPGVGSEWMVGQLTNQLLGPINTLPNQAPREATVCAAKQHLSQGTLLTFNRSQPKTQKRFT